MESYIGSSVDVSNAGDINGDGFDDLIIGVPFISDGRGPAFSNTISASYVVFGAPNFSSDGLDLSTLHGSDSFVIPSEEDDLVESVSTAGDINGDGVDDLLVGGLDGLSYTDSSESYVIDRFSQMVAQCHQARRNVIILRSSPQQFTLVNRRPPRLRRIDVWWGGLQSNGGLMLILAYLLRTSWEWRGAEICLKLVVSTEAAAESAEENLRQLAESLRIGAVPQVIVAYDRPFDEILKISSQTADLVLLGLATPDSVDDFSDYYTKLHTRIIGLPNALLVMASEELAFSDVLQKE